MSGERTIYGWTLRLLRGHDQRFAGKHPVAARIGAGGLQKQSVLFRMDLQDLQPKGDGVSDKNRFREFQGL